MRSQAFNSAAATAAEHILVPLDTDVANWLRTQRDLVREVNGLWRFYMYTCRTNELEFDVDAFEASQAGDQFPQYADCVPRVEKRMVSVGTGLSQFTVVY